jgi:kynureninase
MGGLLKEASGSSGNAFVYLRDGLDLTPRTAGWFGDADPFGFQPEPEPHPDIRRRFMGGTTSVASMYHAVEGVRLLLEAGLDAVRRRSLALTDRCIERADAADLPLRSPRAPERRSAMVILEVPEAEALCAHLKAQDIYTDSRKDQYLRMAPFVWNTPAEVDRTFDAIEDALDTGAYRDTALEASGPVT